jgi:hypothetical protein
MNKVRFITHEKDGVNYISLAPPTGSVTTHFRVFDGILIVALLAGFVSLVLFLAK